MNTETIQDLGRIKTHQKGISGSTLKIIAVISMLIDHIGAIILMRALIWYGIFDAIGTPTEAAFIEAHAGLFYTYVVFRQLGRIAFPIFCFLLVQGFLHTHNLKKYLSRLFLFALVSEVPFDLGILGVPFDWRFQNVYFTLFLGVLAIAGIRMAEEKKEWHMSGRVLLGLLAALLCAGAALLLKTDYDVPGVLAIVALYLLRKRKTLSVGVGCAVLREIPAFISMLPVYFYNGKRGINMKWFFYLFYPAHILLLYLIACALGLGQVNIGF